MTDLKITLIGTEATNIRLSIKNVGTNCRIVQSNNLMLGGCLTNSFGSVIDNEANEMKGYLGPIVSMAAQYLRLEANEEITSKKIDLSLGYNLKYGKSYEVHYTNYLRCTLCDYERTYVRCVQESNSINVSYSMTAEENDQPNLSGEVIPVS